MKHNKLHRRPRGARQEHHTTDFKGILQSSQQLAIERLLWRAALANRLAKAAPTASGRVRFYEQKSLAVSRLILLGAGRFEELLFPRRLVTVALSNGRRLHVPVDHLLPEVRHRLSTFVERHVAAA